MSGGASNPKRSAGDFRSYHQLLLVNVAVNDDASKSAAFHTSLPNIGAVIFVPVLVLEVYVIYVEELFVLVLLVKQLKVILLLVLLLLIYNIMCI